MILIIDGNELNYKTTICNKLADKLGYKVIKGSSFEQSTCSHDELFGKFLDIIVGNENVIVDRYIYSNLTYAPLYEGFAMINNGERRLIESMMEIAKAKLIYLHTDTEVLEQRYEQRGDKDVDKEKLATINDKFNEVMENTNYKFYSFDTNKFTSDQIVDMILKLN